MPNIKKKTILISNDDGIHAPGLKPLIRVMERFGRVIVCVPDKERSASSHSFTLGSPLRARKISPSMYAVSGTPADSVRFGIIEIGKKNVDIVIAGINNGENLGSDVIYSGTVAAAREAVLAGIPGIAASLVTRSGKHYATAAEITGMLAAALMKGKDKFFLNVNIPDLPADRIRGIAVTSQGRKKYKDTIRRSTDSRGNKQYWLKSSLLPVRNPSHSDIRMFARGFVTVTPLIIDTTDIPAMKRIGRILKAL